MQFCMAIMFTLKIICSSDEQRNNRWMSRRGIQIQRFNSRQRFVFSRHRRRVSNYNSYKSYVAKRYQEATGRIDVGVRRWPSKPWIVGSHLASNFSFSHVGDAFDSWPWRMIYSYTFDQRRVSIYKSYVAKRIQGRSGVGVKHWNSICLLNI